MPNSKQIVYLSQSQYTELIANGSITVDGVTVQYDENDIYVTPQAEPVTDVRINGTSIAANGVANIPLASNTSYGVIKVQPYNGLRQNTSGFLETAEAEAAEIKQGTPHFKPIVPCRQHNATFYGLAKASGDTTQSQSANEVGTYTPEAKGAIQQMLGVSDLIATAENDLVASKAYAIGDIFTANGKLYKATAAIAADAAIIPEVEGEEIAGANCVETSVGEGFVKFTDYATTNSAGIVKILPANGIMIDGNKDLAINYPSDSQIKNGAAYYRPLVPALQHKSVFYGLAKAAGADEKDSTLPVGQYTDTAKSAIRSMIGATSSNVIAVQDTQPTSTDTKIWLPETAETPVEVPTVAEMNAALSEKVGDVQIDGASVVENGVANIPIASTTNLGTVKIFPSYGISLTNNSVSILKAVDDDIKHGNGTYRPIVPSQIHMATFYGLAKAAGDTTQSQSSNTVGTYTNEAKVAINTMIGSVSKESLENAGITSKTYSTKFGGEFSVTTATTSGWLNPYARASVTGRINKENMHRVIFNGTEYVLRTRLWYNKDSELKVYEYLGNLGLYIESTAGVPGGTDNVPFVIISDLNNSSSIDVITQTAGTYTILVEQINPTKIDLPKSLIWGDSYVPIEKNNNGGTYNGFSFGVNELNNKRGTFAFGYGNKIENEFSLAFGRLNNITMPGSTAIGIKNNITGSNGIAIGENNNITSSDGVAIGDSLNVNSLMTAVGKNNVPANTVFPNWANNTQYHKGDMVYAVWNPSESATSPILLWVCIVDHISPSSGTFFNTNSADNRSWTLAPTTGDTAFVVGNGNNITSSNAMKVDWLGNTYVGGNLYVNCDSDSTNGIKVATVNDILVNDVQINGTSVLNSGIANIPIASDSTAGTIMVGNGLAITASGRLITNYAGLSTIKEAVSSYNPITPAHQHESVFYGLATAAGDTTQSTSNNVTGTYTDEALAKIQKMLGLYQRGELIADFTTTEDSESVTVNTDLNGQPFELWRVKIIVHLKALTTGTTSYYLSNVFVTNEENNARNVYYGLPTLRQNDANKSTFFFDFETFGSYMVRSFATNNTAGFGQSTNNVISYYQNISPKCITGFQIHQYSSTTSLVPAGTQILIYGTRV